MNVKAATSSRITPGVHTASLVSIEKDVQDTKNGPSDVMALTLNIEDHGNYTQKFFKPTSTERTDGMYGPNPSQMEQFMCIVRQILEAVNPDFGKDIEAGTLKLNGNFNQIVKALGDYCANFTDKQFKVKFMPQSSGFASIPSFVANIARDGKTLRMTNIVIGENVALTPAEERKIKAAAVAAPSAMPEKKAVNTSDLLGSVMEDLEPASTNDNDDNDLPF